ncbi:hypothetical protein [Microcoleus sp. N9_A1]|uniref:hypothetical protein n=1 Tax=Microcoleus sp. N9_A1 TaxID=3055380 RepID=UPI002FCFAD2A
MRKIYQAFSQMIKKFNFLIVMTTCASFEKLIARFSLVGHPNIFTNQEFDWVETLEANWSRIRQELDEILKHREELPNF